MRRRGLLRGLAASACWPMVSVPVSAQSSPAWPHRPLRLTVAYPPGGVSDDTARLLAAGLGPRLGVNVVVDNRPGAGGLLALEALGRGRPDAQWLCYCAISPLVVDAPEAGRAAAGGSAQLPPPGAALGQVMPLVSVMDTPSLVLAHPGFAPDSLAEVAAYLRAGRGPVRWATSGMGTVGHRVMAQVRQALGVDIIHVPYKGGGQQINDALSGEFELLSSNVASLQLQYLREGRFKALAVGAPQRLAVLPGVPTLAELGFTSANLVSTFGLFITHGAPVERVLLLNQAVNAVLAQPDLRQRMLASNNLPTGGSAEAFAMRIGQERARQQGAAAWPRS